MHLPRRPALPVLLALAALAAVTVLAGCGSSADVEAASPPAGGMGMGAAGAGGMIAGVVAAPGDALLTFGPGSERDGSVVVERVKAPCDCWVVVRSAESNAILGKTRVSEGEHDDVAIPLSAADGPTVTVALHADCGVAEEFEFDDARIERSADRPVLVKRTPVASPLTLDGFGVLEAGHLSSLLAEDQPGVTNNLHVEYARVPGPSWISVRLIENGLPTQTVAYMARGKGESFAFDIPINGVALTERVMVTLHADTGVIGSYEYDSGDPLGSEDKPFVSAGRAVARTIRVK